MHSDQRLSSGLRPPPLTVSLQKLPYPKSVFFFTINEFCERFSYFGLKAVLTIYLSDVLLFTQSQAKIVFHTFILLVCLFPLFGAILADSLLGKFRTIIYLSFVYAIGYIILALAATPVLNLPQTISLVGLGLIAIGNGGIKPCVAAFGGDQFVLPEQRTQLTVYFSIFVFVSNFGSLISTMLTPMLREMHCLGNQQCFTLAFGVPGVLMITSLVVFGLGWPLYKIHKPDENIVITVGKCIGYAIKEKWTSKEKKHHWLDFACERYGEQLVNDIKALLHILLLYIPLPIFWSLFDQQGASWTFMARNMNGNLGFYTILPDQIHVVNPFLVLVFIPLFDYAIYPMLNKMHLLRKPLQRLGCAGVLMAVSFCIATGVSLAIEAENPILPKDGEGELIVYNNYECDLKFAYKVDTNEFSAPKDLYKGEFKIIGFEFEKTKMLEYKLFDGECIPNNYITPFKVKLKETKSIGLLLDGAVSFEDDRKKNVNGFPSLRVVTNKKLNNVYQVVFEINDRILKTNTSDQSKQQIPTPHNYTVKFDDKVLGEHNFKLGGVYTVIFNINENGTAKSELHVFEVTPHNRLHMLWLVPQYVILTMAEVMFQITGLEFSYSQAPSGMKSLLQAFWVLTSAFGNMVVIIIELADIFEKQSLNFLMYASLMLIGMFIFALIAMQYKYIKNVADR